VLVDAVSQDAAAQALRLLGDVCLCLNLLALQAAQLLLHALQLANHGLAPLIHLLQPAIRYNSMTTNLSMQVTRPAGLELANYGLAPPISSPQACR
jgi:hypothetical protein